LETPPRLTYAEASWERSVALPDSLDDVLDRALAPWPELARREHTVLSGGLRTLNVRLGEDVVARVALAGGAGERDLAVERALLEKMAPRVRVPRVLGGDGGVLLLEHVAHEELPATSEAGAAVGLTAAAIHAERFPTWGFFDRVLVPKAPVPDAFRGLCDHLEQSLDAAAARLGPLADGVRRTWHEEERVLREACATACLLHGDFKPANLKWIPAERAVLVLDWEFAWAGPALFDLGQLFRWQVPDAFAGPFERAYLAAGGTLPGGWRRTAEVLDLVNLLGFLAAPGDHPRRDADCRARIERTLAERA
jgi:hypothetical protein